ncbi:unnamed protein product, partial [Polarella glacialis]
FAPPAFAERSAGSRPRSGSQSSHGTSCRNSSSAASREVVCSAFAPSYREGEPVFVLEVCGPGVQPQVPQDRRRLAFAPPPEESGEAQLYSSLIIGRAHQMDFWQEVLQPDAFSTLSRQHLEVQTWRSASGSARFSFLVRNLSDVNFVHVLGGKGEANEEQPVALTRSEQRHLLDGDCLMMNIGQSHNFWLAFSDLTASTSMQAQRPAELGEEVSPLSLDRPGLPDAT